MTRLPTHPSRLPGRGDHRVLGGAVLGAVGSRPIVVDVAADAIVGKPLDDSTASADAVAEAAKLARKAATPMDNTDFQTQWRGRMVERYVTAALRESAGLDPGIRQPRHRLM